MSILLFVYGTLQRGQRNQHYLAGQRFVGVTRTVASYRLYDLGPYPALVEAVDGMVVIGELWEVDEVALAAIDILEGTPELFERRPVSLEPESRSATAYFYKGAVEGLRECAGRWPVRNSAE